VYLHTIEEYARTTDTPDRQGPHRLVRRRMPVPDDPIPRPDRPRQRTMGHPTEALNAFAITFESRLEHNNNQ
jgi:hypothetical protein